jgi:hypothetical protein
MKLSSLALVLALAVLPACAETNAQLQPLATTTAGPAGRPAMLTAESGAWETAPARLIDNATPVGVRLTNVLNQPIRVSYADFSLFDQSGRRYAVISPFPVTTAQRENTAGPRSALASPYLPVARTEAGGDPNIPQQYDWYKFGLDHGSKDMVSQPAAGPSLWAAMVAPQYVPATPRGFYVAAREQPYFVNWPAWTDGLQEPPGYEALVMSWNAVPNLGPVSPDLQRRALPEGVLAPGGDITGILSVAAGRTYPRSPGPRVARALATSGWVTTAPFSTTSRSHGLMVKASVSSATRSGRGEAQLWATRTAVRRSATPARLRVRTASASVTPVSAISSTRRTRRPATWAGGGSRICGSWWTSRSPSRRDRRMG